MEYASLYLQYRFWAVRTTSKGFGCISSWTTLFLWYQIVHNMMKMFCIYSIKTSSSKLWDIINPFNHWCTEIPRRSDVWTANGYPCQQALAKGQKRNKWVVDSYSQLQKGQRPLSILPLFLRSCLVRRPSCKSFQIKIQIFCGVLIFHIGFHTLLSAWDWLWWSL